MRRSCWNGVVRNADHPRIVSRISAIAMIVVTLLLQACLTISPIPLNAQTPQLEIPPADKLRLNVAVYIPEPLGGRMLISLRSIDGNGSNQSLDTVDRTDTLNGEGMYPVGRELVKLSEETFSQLFTQVTVLRQLPQPGEYDAIVRIAITEAHVHQIMSRSFMSVDFTVGLTLSWNLSVLNKDNVELFERTEITPVIERKLGWSLSMGPFFTLVGELTSEQLSSLARRWAALLQSSEELGAETKRLAGERA